MLITYDEATKLIRSGKLLHLAGSESLLKKLPCGNWIGGSTEYFLVEDGYEVAANLVFITELKYKDFTVIAYTTNEIKNVATDAYKNGFSIIIVPGNSSVHKEYTRCMASRSMTGLYKKSSKNISGWVAGIHNETSTQPPIVINGITKEIYTDKAVALHLQNPVSKEASVDITNIFEQDKSTAVIEFPDEGFSINKCFVDGKEVVFADYIDQNNIDIMLPLVGDYSGNSVNISFKTIENGTVNFYAPVFPGVKYHMAKSICDYEKEFNKRLSKHKNENTAFSATAYSIYC
ncbi:MAG: hypothetical protein LBC96_02005 [Lachnospiraceae bacterium]|nr:hypothetical protein [Lachnospiraceae bacterium]